MYLYTYVYIDIYATTSEHWPQRIIDGYGWCRVSIRRTIETKRGMDRESGLAATSASACAGLFLDGWTAGRGLPFSPYPPHPPRPPTYYSSLLPPFATLRPPTCDAIRLRNTKPTWLPCSSCSLYDHHHQKQLYMWYRVTVYTHTHVYTCDSFFLSSFPRLQTLVFHFPFLVFKILYRLTLSIFDWNTSCRRISLNLPFIIIILYINLPFERN